MNKNTKNEPPQGRMAREYAECPQNDLTPGTKGRKEKSQIYRAESKRRQNLILS